MRAGRRWGLNARAQESRTYKISEPSVPADCPHPPFGHLIPAGGGRQAVLTISLLPLAGRRRSAQDEGYSTAGTAIASIFAASAWIASCAERDS